MRSTIARRINRIAWYVLLLVAVAAAILWAAYAINPDGVKRTAARLLVVHDTPQHSNIIFVLGGNYAVRAPAAASLYRQGWAPLVVFAREPEVTRSPGSPGNFSDVTAEILAADGVPRERIIQIRTRDGVKTTADEARALAFFLRSHPVDRVMVVTSAFHSRRAKMALSRSLAFTGTSLCMIPAEDSTYTSENWWKDREGTLQFQEEYIKNLYYFLTFWG